MKEGSELVFGEMMTDRGWDVDKELSGRKYRREEVQYSIVDRREGPLTASYVGDASPDPV